MLSSPSRQSGFRNFYGPDLGNPRGMEQNEVSGIGRDGGEVSFEAPGGNGSVLKLNSQNAVPGICFRENIRILSSVPGGCG